MIDLSNLGGLENLYPVELALEWARRGCSVLPVDPETKAPWVGKSWERKATTDQVEIHAWWYFRPDARVGIKTGLACGCGCGDGPDVLDFDVSDGKPGAQQLQTLVLDGVLDGTQALRVKTPSGGEHWWFAGSTQHNKQNDDSVWGVDFRAHHGMVLAPGNPGYTVRGVPWDKLGDLSWESVAACPGLIAKPTRPDRLPPAHGGSLPTAPKGKLVAPSRFDNSAGEESPLDWFCQQNDLGKMLSDDGWTYGYTHEGRDYYARPGKPLKDGVSGNVMTNSDGRQTLINYSTSLPWLPTDRGLSAAQYLACRDHGGDLRQAAKQIRTGLMPQRQVAKTMALVPPPVTQTAVAGMAVGAAAPGTTENTPGAELVPVSVVGPPAMVVEFWDQRPEFQAIRQLARERSVSPWALLGAVLALVTCRVGPHVVLPPIVGGVASLNLLVGLVGPAGKGKGAAWMVAEEYLDVKGRFTTEEVGTSQGIDSCFTETTPKAGSVQFNDVAFFYVPEIDTMKAHSEMSGSALLPHLRKIWSGEALGARYAKAENRRPVRAHTYRASVVAGIQPARSGLLLADVDGGTPQRWLWLPVFDPDAPDPRARLKAPRYAGTPPVIDYDVWIPLGEQRGEKNEPIPVEAKPRYELQVCKEAEDEIRIARYENLRSEYGSMDSHSLLTRLKVATALAFLFKMHSVTAWLWELTTPIMWVSNDTRAKCVQAVADAEAEEHKNRGRNRSIQDAAADVMRVQLKDARAERIQELGGKLLGAMSAEPGRAYSPRDLMQLLGDARTRKEYWSDVEAALVATPGVLQGPEVSSGGKKIRKLSWSLPPV